MRALCWHGKNDGRVDSVEVPKIEDKEIDPSFVITHRMPLEQAADAYEIFEKKEDGCIKVVLQPG